MRLSKLGRVVFLIGFALSMILVAKMAPYHFRTEQRHWLDVYYTDQGQLVSPPQGYLAANNWHTLINLPAEIAGSHLFVVLFSLFETPGALRADIWLVARLVLSLFWWYSLGLAITCAKRAMERRRATHDSSRIDNRTDRSECCGVWSWRLSRMGWILFLIGFLASTTLLMWMAVYHFQPEHRTWLDGQYNRPASYLPTVRGYSAAMGSFVLLNFPAEGVLTFLCGFSFLLLDTPVSWRADIVLGGRAVFSLLWWYLLGLAATAIQRAMARRQAARDPSPAAAAESEGGDAG